MNEISCKVCMDLIPLVQDGIASEDSREAVEQHISKCESCAAYYSGEIPPVADTDKLILYAVPLLLLFTNVISFILNVLRGIEELGMYSRVLWTGIYSIFVVVGIVIAGLIHYAFRKE